MAQVVIVFLEESPASRAIEVEIGYNPKRILPFILYQLKTEDNLLLVV
jgi:hypothetical protein